MKNIFIVFILLSLSINAAAQDMFTDVIVNGDISRLDNEIEADSIVKLTKPELRILRNTIFAKHGFLFASNDMREHFSGFSWYKGVSRTVQGKLKRNDWINIAKIQAQELFAAPVRLGFVPVKGGTFQMGSNNGSPDERPVHTVTVSDFYMSKYELTQREWKNMLWNRRLWYNMGFTPVKDNRYEENYLPVGRISWLEAVDYCNWRSLQEGLTPAYKIEINGAAWDRSVSGHGLPAKADRVTWDRSANGYRLPTEAEWEYAAKGGDGSPGNYAYSGSNNVNEVAWYNRGRTQEVGTKKPNGLGLYDMSGNVSEMCWDFYDENYYTNNPQNDPIGPDFGSKRVYRGGNWDDNDKDMLRTTRRSSIYDSSSSKTSSLGFRLVRNAD